IFDYHSETGVRPLDFMEFLAYLASISMMLAIAYGVGLFISHFFPTIIAVSIFRAAFKRRDQKIVATIEGITYRDKSKTVTCGWDEVSNFYATKKFPAILPTYVVETQQGNFDFSFFLNGPVSLPAVISQRTKFAEKELGQ